MAKNRTYNPSITYIPGSGNLTGLNTKDKTSLVNAINENAGNIAKKADKTDLSSKANNTDLTAEIARAKGTENTITTQLNQISSKLSNSITTESTRAKGIEAGLRTDVDALKNKPTSGINTDVQTALDLKAGKTELTNEISRAKGVEATKLDKTAKAADSALLEGKTKAQIATEIEASIIAGAPTTLNTLKELSDKLTADEGAVTTLTTLVGTKADKTALATLKTDVDLKATDADLKAEVTRAKGVEATLRTDITALQTAGTNPGSVGPSVGINTDVQTALDLKADKTDIGDLTTLSTTAKGSLVGAINELDTQVSGLDIQKDLKLDLIRRAGKDVIVGPNKLTNLNLSGVQVSATNPYELISKGESDTAIKVESDRAKLTERGLRTDVDLKATKIELGKKLDKTGTAADSTLLEGKTKAEVIAEANTTLIDGASTSYNTLKKLEDGLALVSNGASQTDLDAEIARAKGAEGLLSDLDTTFKHTLVGAINEVNNGTYTKAEVDAKLANFLVHSVDFTKAGAVLKDDNIYIVEVTGTADVSYNSKGLTGHIDEGDLLEYIGGQLNPIVNTATGGSGSPSTTTIQPNILAMLSEAKPGQNAHGIAIGAGSGTSHQAEDAIAIGTDAGKTGQKVNSIAIGWEAGKSSQGEGSLAIGAQAGTSSQGENSVAIGFGAANTGQKVESIAIGHSAGRTRQGTKSIAMGLNSAHDDQGDNAIAIGEKSGNSHQKTQAIAIGTSAGQISQETQSVAIGYQAGQRDQKGYSVALGFRAGETGQGTQTVAIGGASALTSQGDNAIAIGYQAAKSSQPAESIAIGHNSSTAKVGDINLKTTTTDVVISGNTMTINGTTIGGAAAATVQSLIHSVDLTTSGATFVADHLYINTANGTPDSSYTIKDTPTSVKEGDLYEYVGGQLSPITSPTTATSPTGTLSGGLNANLLSKINGAKTSQAGDALALGQDAGLTGQSGGAVAIGQASGKTNQGIGSVAIGGNAGDTHQGRDSVAIGNQAGKDTQGTRSIAIGTKAGSDHSNGIAIGYEAGWKSQSYGAIAIGSSAGKSSQGANAIAIGTDSGYSSQGANAIAIGTPLSSNDQHADSIAMGSQAGKGYLPEGGMEFKTAKTSINLDVPYKNKLGLSVNGVYVGPNQPLPNGQTSDRPDAVEGVIAYSQYWDTSLNKLIIYMGGGVWKDAMGTTV